jgi:chromosome segregation ATPase
MYTSIHGSQQMLVSLCNAVNRMQQRLSELEDKLSQSPPPSAVTTVTTVTTGEREKAQDSFKIANDLQNMMTESLASMRSSIATLAGEIDSVKSASSLNNNNNNKNTQEVHELVRREAENSAKKQRDLLEAILGAKFERQVAAAVQAATDRQREEVMAKFAGLEQQLAQLADAQRSMADATAYVAPESTLADDILLELNMAPVQQTGTPDDSTGGKAAGGGRAGRGGRAAGAGRSSGRGK